MGIREELRRERGNLCECCGKRAWEDIHHCLVHDSVRLHAKVTVMENLMVVCRVCHPHLNGHEVRRIFRDKQLERGYDIATWYNSLGLKVKEKWLVGG